MLPHKSNPGNIRACHFTSPICYKKMTICFLCVVTGIFHHIDIFINLFDMVAVGREGVRLEGDNLHFSTNTNSTAVSFICMSTYIASCYFI